MYTGKAVEIPATKVIKMIISTTNLKSCPSCFVDRLTFTNIHKSRLITAIITLRKSKIFIYKRVRSIVYIEKRNKLISTHPSFDFLENRIRHTISFRVFVSDSQIANPFVIPCQTPKCKCTGK